MSLPEDLALTVKEARNVARRTAAVVATEPLDQKALDWTIDDLIADAILDHALGPDRRGSR